MNRLRASLSRGAVLALAAACGLGAFDAQAQIASPPPGKALIVIYRSDKQPVAARIPLIANADRLGDIGNGEYINAVVNPGRTFMRAGDRVLSTLALQTSAGQTYYVLLEAVAGATPVRAEMREMTQGAASRALAQSRPAAAGAAAGAAAIAAAPRAAVPAVPAAPAPAAPAPRAPAAAAPLAAAPAARPAAPPPAAPAAPPPPPRQAQAAPPPRPAPQQQHAPEPEEDESPDWSFAAIVKTGVFNLSSVSQPVGGLASTFKKGAKPVAGVEAEMRAMHGLAFGVELFYYKNEFTPDGTTLKGDQTVFAGLVNAKYYMEATKWLYPFVGVGIGYAGSQFGGDFTGKASGGAYQGMLGADIRFSKNVGLYLEYKHFGSKTSDSNGQNFELGGNGILAGLSFVF